MIGLAALSSQPALAAKISLSLLLAPVAIVRHMISPPFMALARWGVDQYILRKNWTEWGSHRPGLAANMQPMCKHAPRSCLIYLTVMCGKNPTENIDLTLLPLVFQHLPAGTSVQNMAHWAQVC